MFVLFTFIKSVGVTWARLYFEKLILDHCEEYVGEGVRRWGGTVRRPLQFTCEKYWQLMGRECGVGVGEVERKKGADSSLRVTEGMLLFFFACVHFKDD